MNNSPDITIHIPIEHFESLSEVIFTGIRRAKLDPKVRRELKAWWEAEHGLLAEYPLFTDNEKLT